MTQPGDTLDQTPLAAHVLELADHIRQTVRPRPEHTAGSNGHELLRPNRHPGPGGQMKERT